MVPVLKFKGISKGMKITGKLRYESGLTEVLERKMRQMERKLRRGKMRRMSKIKKGRSD